MSELRIAAFNGRSVQRNKIISGHALALYQDVFSIPIEGKVDVIYVLSWVARADMTRSETLQHLIDFYRSVSHKPRTINGYRPGVRMQVLGKPLPTPGPEIELSDFLAYKMPQIAERFERNFNVLDISHGTIDTRLESLTEPWNPETGGTIQVASTREYARQLARLITATSSMHTPELEKELQKLYTIYEQHKIKAQRH